MTNSEKNHEDSRLNFDADAQQPSPIAAPDFPIKLAVASKDGISINEHFGHAKQFHIYQLTPGHCALLETREVAHYCLGQNSDPTAMVNILETIKDCYAVFVAKIGDGPTGKLQAIGVRAVSDYAYQAVADSLLEYTQLQAASEIAS